jgi:hypothetical protein
VTELVARCDTCLAPATYITAAPLPACQGSQIALPAPHHGCGGEWGVLIYQKPFDAGCQQAEEWQEYLPL